jgi:hypothetical protein
MSSTKFLQRRTNVPGQVPGNTDIDLGEIAINTHEGKMYLKRDKFGVVDIVQVGEDAVENVFYVSKSGEFGNSGTSLGDSFKTIDSAVSTITALKSFAFNETKCARDLGYIFDGLYLDIAFGSNYNSVTSGHAYQRAGSNKVTTDQLTPTRVAFNQARGAIGSVEEVKNSTGVNGALYRNNAHWSEIVDILVNGKQSTEQAHDDLRFPEPVVLPTPDANDAAIILQNNRNWLKDELVTYISTNYPALSYDQTKCIRDTGFIIDAIITDLMTGSNYRSITSGIAYERAGALPEAEKPATIDAIVFLRDKMLELSLSDATKASITESVKEIIDIIVNGEQASNVIVYPAAPASTTAQVDAGLQIQNNKTLVINDVIQYIADNFAVQDYDQSKCERDVGHIVDAITIDLMLGTNYNVVTAGLAYQRANALPGGQVSFTIGAWEILRDSINALSISSTTQEFVTASIAEVTDIMTNGVAAANILVFPNSVNTSVNSRNAWNQIENNRTLILDTIIGYISANNEALTYPRTKCSRDVGYIIEALTNDLLFGTNYNTVTAGLAYQRAGAIPAAQIPGTVLTIRNIGVLLSALDISNSSKTQLTANIEIIIDVLEGSVADAPVIVYPIPLNSLNNEEFAHQQIRNNRQLLIDNTIAYITANYPSLSYNVAKCQRDVGYILDGLSYDILYDGNFASRILAFSYFKDGVSQLGGAAEVTASIAAYTNLKAELGSLLAETLPGQDDTSEVQKYQLQQTSRLQGLLQITIDAITAGNYDGVPDLINPDTTAVAEPMILDYATIVAAKTTIQSDSIAYADVYGPVQYSREKCRRDTSYILDGIQHDILYGGNFASFNSARAYFVDGVSQLGGAAEVTASIGAYTHLKTVLSEIVQENFTGQNTSALPATATEAATTGTLLDIIIDVITAGNLTSIATRVLPDFTGIDSTDYNTINGAIVSLKADVIEYADWYGPTTYDRVKCRRDLGYIIDAITHDITYSGGVNSNTGSVACARAYFVGAVSQLGASEIPATLGAYNQLNTILQQIVVGTYAGQNTVAGNATAAEQNKVGLLTGIIIEVITDGDLDGLDTEILPDFTGINGTTAANYATILAAKSTLQGQVIDYTDLNGPVSYDRVRCRRDIGFIVDGLTFDALYGGTHGITLNSRAYFVGAASQLGASEVAATIATYTHLSTILGELVTNTLSSNLTEGANVSGNSGNYASATESGILASNLSILTDVLTAGNLDSLPAIVEPILTSRGVSAELRNAITAVKKIQDFLILQSVNSAKNTGDTTIFLKSGDYQINNPIKLPPKTAIVGDNLRTTTVRPKSVDSDLFYMDNGCFIKDITFRDHQNFAACVAYDPKVESAGAGPFIVQSPYVQNCTSITNDGIGMKIDGSKCSGLKSMVSDAFTQYNAAGIGTYLLNRGYAQLVSIFTISTQTSILAETGGQCSITNSNSSFGDFGLIARGSSEILYDGQLDSAYRLYDDVIRVTNCINRDSSDYITGGVGLPKLPNYGDAMKFDSEDYFYTVLGVDSVGGGKYNLSFEPPLNSDKLKFQDVTFRQRSVITSSSHTFEYVGAGTNTFTAIPQNGGIPRPEREVVYDSENNEGLVVFTSTDQLGDFRIGAELTIKRQEGRIVGETFERSLYAILTPYILALEG